MWAFGKCESIGKIYFVFSPINLDKYFAELDNLMVVTVSSISCYNRNVSLDLNSQNLKKWNLVYGNNKLLQMQIILLKFYY